MKDMVLHMSESTEFSECNHYIHNINGLHHVFALYGVKIAMEQGLKSGKSTHGTGYPGKNPSAHTRRFRGHVHPPGFFPEERGNVVLLYS